jgi:hypothetical protein
MEQLIRILVGNTDPDQRMGQHWVAIYIDFNSKGEYYDPTGRPPFLRAYVNFMKHCHTWTYTPFEYKKKDIPCGDIIAFFTSFMDVQDIP